MKAIVSPSEPPVSLIESAYQQRIDAMTPAERFQRAEEMLAWSRDVMARQILNERGPLPPERLKWEVALRMYGHEPAARELIEKKLADVPDR